MTRHVICYENALLMTEQFLLEGAMKFPEEGVPVTWGFEWHSKPLGKATDLQRGENGAVTVEIDDEILLPFANADVGASFYAFPVTYEHNDEVMVVVEANIRAIAITQHVHWLLSKE